MRKTTRDKSECSALPTNVACIFDDGEIEITSPSKEIVVKFSSGERKFKGQAFLLNFCLPNFYFHAITAYDILRHCGIELGKRDFMGTPVAL
jgi:hypothetical protein